MQVILAIGHQARDDLELADLNRAMRAERARVLHAIVVDGCEVANSQATSGLTRRSRESRPAGFVTWSRQEV